MGYFVMLVEFFMFIKRFNAGADGFRGDPKWVVLARPVKALTIKADEI